MSRWQMVKFNDVLSIKNGKNQKAVENIDGIYPIYGSGGIMSYANDYLCPEFTTIIGRKGSINNPIYVEEKFWNVDTAFGLVANIAKLLPKYLFYFCVSYNFERHNKAVTIPSLTKSDLLEVKIPLPPLEEQQKIAKNLDLASDLVKLYKTKLQEIDKLIQSVFYDMFGDPVTNEKEWEVSKVKHVTSEKLSYGSGASAIKYDGKNRYIRITDINDSGNLNSEIVSPNQIDDKYILKQGDILFARSGATVGKTFMYDEKYGNCIYAGYLIKMKPNTDIVLAEYIMAYTKSQFYKNFILSNMKVVAQPNINAQQYGDLKILLPPLSLQQKFADIVTKIEEQKTEVNQAVQDAEMLYSSLMQEYFE